MRTGFAHGGVVQLDSDGDPAAVGAAVTVALCGHWEHEPPCPLAPHNTSVRPFDQAFAVRVLFACAAEDETRARQLIESALRSGSAASLTGERTTWRCLTSAPLTVQPADEALLTRLASS